MSSHTLLTVKQVAEQLSLSEKGVYGMVESKRLPAYRVGNRLRFHPKEIERWLTANRTGEGQAS